MKTYVRRLNVSSIKFTGSDYRLVPHLLELLGYPHNGMEIPQASNGGKDYFFHRKYLTFAKMNTIIYIHFKVVFCEV